MKYKESYAFTASDANSLLESRGWLNKGTQQDAIGMKTVSVDKFHSNMRVDRLSCSAAHHRTQNWKRRCQKISSQ